MKGEKHRLHENRFYKRSLRNPVSIRFYPRSAQFITDKRAYTNLYVSSQACFHATGS